MVYFLPFLPSSLPLSPFLSPFWNSLPPSADSLKRQRDHSVPSLAPFSEQHGFREKSFKPSSVTPHPEGSWAGCFSFCSLTYGRRELMSMLQDFFFFCMSCIFIAVRAFSSCSALLFTAVLSLLTALVSLVSEHQL